MRKNILRIIDSFYFLFKRIMPLKTFRYALCGGSNLVFDLVLYYVFFHYIVQEKNVDFYFFVMSPHIAALFFVFPITFLSGFLMNKLIVFTDSNLKTRKQVSRYFQVAMGAIVLSYILMKLFVDVLGFYPTPSKLLTIMISVVYSYLLQQMYSFRISK